LGWACINFGHDLSRSRVERHCGDARCAEDNSIRRSQNPNHGFPEGVHVSVGTIVERSTGYSKTANPCPHNLKSINFDVTIRYLSSSTETMGPSGHVAIVVKSGELTLWKNGS
jgi:hypothetical protein